MNRENMKAYAAWTALSEGTGAVAGLLARKGMAFFNAAVRKPPLTPPPAVFPIAWGLLYLLMGIGAARVWLRPVSRSRSRSLFLFLTQLAVNFLWTLVFFNLRFYGAALFTLAALWTLILCMVLSFRKVDVPAALAQIPYLLWVLFAAYLNGGVWLLNGTG